MPTPKEIAAAVREELSDELDAIASFDVESYKDTTAQLHTLERRVLTAVEGLEAAVERLGGGDPQ